MTVYLDHNATTPPHPDVLDAMREAELTAWANPSSVHRAGQRARAQLDRARSAVAELVGLSARDVLFTSGGTEANNIALRALGGAGLVTTAIEHPSVLHTAQSMERDGVPIGVARPDPAGSVTTQALERAATGIEHLSLLSIQMVNHETGVVMDLPAASAWARERGALVHVDLVQAVGKIELFHDADLVTVSAHKIRGPKGIGALVTRPRVKLGAIMAGGAQERGLRPGTQSAALAAGFVVAAERAKHGPERYRKLRALRDALETSLSALGGDRVAINGAGDRVPHVSNLSWRGWRGPELCAALDLEGVAISSGSACSAGTAEPSKVIEAMLGRERAASAIRISLGEVTTASDIEACIAAFERVCGRTGTT